MLGLLAQTGGSNLEDFIDVSSVTLVDTIGAIVLILGGFIAARLVRRPLRRRLDKANLPAGASGLVTKLFTAAVVSIGIVFALPLLGVDVTPVYVLLFVVAAIVVVSGRVLIENYGAGVLLQSEGHFQPEDLIVTNDHMGRVIEVSSRVTTLETIDGRKVVLPNTSVLSAPLEVLTSEPSRRTEMTVGLEYGTNLDRAVEILAEAARTPDAVLDSPPVEVYVAEFAESSIDFIVWYWHASDFRSSLEATDAVARSIDRACRQNGLTIAFPQRTLWWGGKTNRSTAPRDET